MIVYLDANIVIYLVEDHPLWKPKVVTRIVSFRSAGDEIGISDAHRLECLVGPLILGDAASLADYHTFFGDPTVKALSLTAKVCERAAQIRAAHQYKPLDSLHLAAAVENGCGKFLTNDGQLSGFPDLTVELLT